MSLRDFVKNLTLSEIDALRQMLNRKELGNYISVLYPDTGPLRRELYPKHLSFFAAGREYASDGAVS